MSDALRRGAASPPQNGPAPGPWRRAAAAVLAVGWLGACASTSEIILIALPATRGADFAREATPLPEIPIAGVLLVRRLSIPEYMVARRVRYASDTARLAEWPDAVWAERIEVGMARELVAALREALPAWRVCDAACGDSPAEVTLKVDLQRLDVLRGEGRLVARAQIQLSLLRPGSTATTVLPAASQSFVQALPADSAQGQARAMTDLLRSIADACAAAVLRGSAALPPAVGTP